MKRLEKRNIVSLTGTKIFRSGVKCISVLLICTVLTGCGRVGTPTLVVCKEDDSTVYAYDGDGYYYLYDSLSNTAIPIRDIGLSMYPALNPIPRDGTYSLVNLGEGLYSATLTDIEAYLNKLLSNDFALTLVERSPNYYECILIRSDMSVRLIYTSDDIVHIYGKKSDETYCQPAYITGND